MLFNLAFTYITAIAIAGGQVEDEGGSPYSITRQRAADSVEVVREDGLTVFVISSSNGVGWAKLRSERAWPMRAKVRLEYVEDRPWQHLEHFGISASGVLVATNLNGDLTVRSTGNDEEGAARLSPEERQRKFEMEVSKTDSAIEIELPMQWLAGQREFMLRWIDQYRN